MSFTIIVAFGMSLLATAIMTRKIKTQRHSETNYGDGSELNMRPVDDSDDDDCYRSLATKDLPASWK